jgi:hypothetical protein
MTNHTERALGIEIEVPDVKGLTTEPIKVAAIHKPDTDDNGVRPLQIVSGKVE